MTKLRLIYFDLHGFNIDFSEFKIDLDGNKLDKLASQSEVTAWPLEFENQRLNTKT